ncbi:MAG: TonB-dependent receptor [Cyclobacteriaceae bacterium]|nr:TonB-dependent receptor [Cyclobacteriaceae bacterium]
MKTLYLMLVTLLGSTPLWGQGTQTIRGVVIDQDSKAPVIGANIIIVGSDPIKGAATDLNGQYVIDGVEPGRYSLKVTSVGYEELMSTNVLVVAGKQLELNFEMKESLVTLSEIVVTAASDKTELNNDLTTVSGRTFNTEETSRFAGGRNDVSRMAQNFAGVSNVNDARNDIVIRGNSPSGLLWRLEGIDIPSPNHFASFGSTGGPVSMLNNNTLTKSDFITAAFPAMYGNALGGVFDLQMRNGNNLKREYLGQVGFNGFELGAEGPFKEGGKASYMINYRYSTLGVFKKMGINFGTGSAVPNYQDLSFKINLPTAKAGKFTLFGVGGMSDISFLGSETDFSKNAGNLYGNENEDLYDKSKTGVFGITHSYVFSPRTSYKLTIASSGIQTLINIDSLTWSNAAVPELQASTRYYNQSLTQYQQSAHLTLNHKFNAANTLVAGLLLNHYDVNFGDSVLRQTTAHNVYWRPIKKGAGTSLLTQAYVNWQHRFSDRLTLNAGLHTQQFTLGSASAVEPRAGLRFNLTTRQSLSLGGGIHNQIQSLPVYYIRTYQGDINSNQDLGFTRSQHIALAYDLNFNRDFRLKLETYYQSIDKAPVEKFASSFSMLNAGAGFVLPDKFNLTNQGIGRNYGVEFTLEKFYSQQYYFLLTTSLFKSEYRGSDQIWRSTAFDGGYIVNLLGGKEWSLGSKNRTLGINWKVTAAGGRRYTPIDVQASLASGQVTYINEKENAQQYPGYFRTDLKISYRINKGRITQEFALDIQNVTNHKNIFQETFNRRTGVITRENQLGLFPIPQYRILF